jgi:tetratricopeptide (TPR) repeat protein
MVPPRAAKCAEWRPGALVRLLLTYPRMAPHPLDTLLARAQTHLAGARYPQAIGAFRAAVAVAGPKVVHAHLGLADALAACGRRSEAVDGLARAAEACTAREEHERATDLLGRALALDPSRTELHLELAMVEEAQGRHDAAVLRLEGLADRYMDAGRFEDAAELLCVVASWDDPSPAESPAPVVAAPVVAAPVVAAPVVAAPEVFPRNAALITGATVIARNPLLATFATTPLVHEPAPLVRDDEVTCARAELVVVPPPAPRPVPSTPAEPRDTALVERLRARAGLRPAGVVSHPAAIRSTEPISIRRSLERAPVQDDDVTRYFRRLSWPASPRP